MENLISDNVVSINSKKILGAYIDAQGSEFIPEGMYFWAGVILSVLLPQYTFYVYGGFIPVIAFAVSVVVGALYGVAMYWSPYRPPSCVNAEAADAETKAQVPPREGTSRKWA